MMEIYTVTTAFNGDSPDGSAQADVELFTTLEAARAHYEHARTVNDHHGPLTSYEYPFGSAPEDGIPTHGFTLAYAGDGGEDDEDTVGIRLAVHTAHEDAPGGEEA